MFVRVKRAQVFEVGLAMWRFVKKKLQYVRLHGLVCEYTWTIANKLATIAIVLVILCECKEVNDS